MESASKVESVQIRHDVGAGHCRGWSQSLAPICADFFPTSMVDMSRSPSIQSFTSVDSISMLASPTREASATPSTALHEDDVPRGTTPDLGEEPVAQSAPQAHRFYIKDGNVKFRVSFLLTKGSRVASLNCDSA